MGQPEAHDNKEGGEELQQQARLETLKTPRRLDLAEVPKGIGHTGIKISAEISPDIEATSPLNLSGVRENKSINITSTRENLTYKRDNYVYFTSIDSELATPIIRALSDLNLISVDDQRAAKPKIGQVLVTPRGKTRVFSVVIKSRYFDKISRDNIKIGLENLREILRDMGVKSFRTSNTGDFSEELPPDIWSDLLEGIFGQSDIDITVCYGKITVPSPEDRADIIAEMHSSMVGGHKGIGKTYRRIREKFDWPKMRDQVSEFIQKCSSFQEQKLVRVKTREPMLITDTPAEPFEKISLDTVGPLPPTPDNSRHILK